ncbi:MAG: class I SAM-dependent methyltransferase [Chloroflexi bacterium]|nr:class I SAM-dependent methyltransferase [Chloroflexota bacterium]
MPRFSDFDTRQYRMVDARTGYGEWVATYEGTVEDEMDLALLARVTTVDWSAVREAADLGSGTGRTGAWLHGQGVGAIDGVDVTPEMLERARRRGVFRRLTVADVAATGLPDAAYDLITTSLVDEHLEDLLPLYREAFRLGRPGAAYVLVGYHPEFMMVSGMPTHYRNAAGEEIAIDTHLHLISEHVQAALGAGWTLAEMHERLIDDAWVALKPRWERYRGHPISFAFVWRKPA